MGARTITSVEGMKTIAYEIAEQLTEMLGPPKRNRSGKLKWRTPDWYVQAVSGGLGPIGGFKGFNELKKMGFIYRIPRIIAIQAEGCGPIGDAWKQGMDDARAVHN